MRLSHGEVIATTTKLDITDGAFKPYELAGISRRLSAIDASGFNITELRLSAARNVSFAKIW